MPRQKFHINLPAIQVRGSVWSGIVTVWFFHLKVSEEPTSARGWVTVLTSASSGASLRISFMQMITKWHIPMMRTSYSVTIYQNCLPPKFKTSELSIAHIIFFLSKQHWSALYPLHSAPSLLSHLISSNPSSHQSFSKSSHIYFICTSLIKSCFSIFSELIANLANVSILQGTFPSSFKIAQVIPLLRKPGLDKDTLVITGQFQTLTTFQNSLSA